MNYTEFLELAKSNKDISLEHGGLFEKYTRTPYNYNMPKEETDLYYAKYNEFFKDNGFIYIDYVKNGYSGGDCWGGECTYFENDDIPEFSNLINFLTDNFPNLKYLDIKGIENDLIREEDYCDSYDYYGNYNNINIKYVVVKELYEYMLNKEMFNV